MATKQETLTVRIEQGMYYKFIEKCESMNRPHPEVVREIMSAFNDGRLKIIQTKEQIEQKKELYDVNRK